MSTPMPGAAVRPAYLELPGRLRVHCLTAGYAGTPVVLLHGGGIDAASFCWRYAIGALAEAGHRVFAPDWPGYGDSGGMVRQALAALVGDPGALSEDTVEEACDLIRRPGAGRAFHTTQAGEAGWRRLRSDCTEQLPDLAVPTLIIHGEADPLVPVAWARRAQQRIPGARLVTLPGVGHLSPREAPVAVNAAIGDFLTSLDRTRSRKTAGETENQR